LPEGALQAAAAAAAAAAAVSGVVCLGHLAGLVESGSDVCLQFAGTCPLHVRCVAGIPHSMYIGK
jgi:hypothetical protein